jgi:hypothetical protein
MSARSENHSGEAVLRGAAGELVSVRITVEPRMLEDLLEALARVPFPINPQIYHQAVLVGLNSEGKRESSAATLVEFPAYRNDLEQVRNLLESSGVNAYNFSVRGMMENIQANGRLRDDVPWLVWQDVPPPQVH